MKVITMMREWCASEKPFLYWELTEAAVPEHQKLSKAACSAEQVLNVQSAETGDTPKSVPRSAGESQCSRRIAVFATANGRRRSRRLSDVCNTHRGAAMHLKQALLTYGNMRGTSISYSAAAEKLQLVAGKRFLFTSGDKRILKPMDPETFRELFTCRLESLSPVEGAHVISSGDAFDLKSAWESQGRTALFGLNFQTSVTYAGARIATNCSRA